MAKAIINNAILLKDWIDPAVPQRISWWPETLIWKVMGLMLIAVLVYFLYQKIKQWHALAYQRHAIKVLKNINLDNENTAFREANKIIKAVLLHAYPRSNVARLYGESLLHFLDQSGHCHLHSALGGNGKTH